MGPVPVGTPLPAGTPWPCDTGAVVADADVDLFTVIQLANFSAPVTERSKIIDLATTCALSHDITVPPNLNEQQHCEKVHLAKEHAQGEEWEFCIDALDHGGGIRASSARRNYKVVASRVEELIRDWANPTPVPDDLPDSPAGD
jgi:hypothetical protein